MKRNEQGIAFLGAGKMGEAIIAALLQSRFCEPATIIACEVVAERRKMLKERYGIGVTDDLMSLPGSCSRVVLATKPQDLDAALQQLAPELDKNHLLISIVAGKRLSRLEELAGGECRVVRVMPNLNVAAGVGMSAYAGGSRATAADLAFVAQLLASCGAAIELEEGLFDVVTALSGSGPAYFARFMQAMAEAAVGLGMPQQAAMLLANRTMSGTAIYLQQREVAPAEFIRAVCSPGGTTAAGLALLEASDLTEVVAATLEAAARRSRELNGN